VKLRAFAVSFLVKVHQFFGGEESNLQSKQNSMIISSLKSSASILSN
jgi:hypothetical protein